MPLQAIDVAIVPGGGAVDQSVVVTSSLWDKDKRPIAPAQLNIELSSLRLSSIYETVEAIINLDYANYRLSLVGASTHLRHGAGGAVGSGR
jgi:hypothetical protein